jgi:hypothetical protein
VRGAAFVIYGSIRTFMQGLEGPDGAHSCQLAVKPRKSSFTRAAKAFNNCFGFKRDLGEVYGMNLDTLGASDFIFV